MPGLRRWPAKRGKHREGVEHNDATTRHDQSLPIVRRVCLVLERWRGGRVLPQGRVLPKIVAQGAPLLMRISGVPNDMLRRTSGARLLPPAEARLASQKSISGGCASGGRELTPNARPMRSVFHYCVGAACLFPPCLARTARTEPSLHHNARRPCQPCPRGGSFPGRLLLISPCLHNLARRLMLAAATDSVVLAGLFCSRSVWRCGRSSGA